MQFAIRLTNDNHNQTTSDNFHSSLTSRSSITGLDSAYTTTRYTRGNVTASTHYLLDTGGNVPGSVSGYAQYDYYDNQALTTTKPPNFMPSYSTGRLTAVCYGGATSSTGSYQSYDQLGRVNLSYQQTASQNYGFGYGYNLASEMISETYASGRQVITEYDSAGRAAGISARGFYYAGATASDATNRIQYAAQGAVSVMLLGNGKWEHTNFNSRLQPTQIGLGISGTDSSVMKLDYGYGTTTNNGNEMSQTITAPKANGGNLVLIQTYTYDSLNRLLTASENGSPSWAQSYDYDRYGNRAVNPSSTLIPNPALTPTSLNNFSTTTNRITLSGFAYDDAGNMKNDPTTTPNPPNGMTYDGENRQTSYTKANAATSYAYDGDGHRVKKVVGSVTTFFVYNAMGELTAEYTNDTTAPVGGGGTSYLTSDDLGSMRVVAKGDGTVKARYDYLPFGEEIPSTIGSRGGVTGYGGADSTKQKFTEKERDNESGLDWFGPGRYYSSPHGRFTSTDPLLSSGQPPDPQTWNRYSYTLNNPLRYTDPLGMWVYAAGTTDEQKRQFERGLDRARQARDHYRPGSAEYNRLNRSLSAYGTVNVDNGVTVRFAAAATPANTFVGIRADDPNHPGDKVSTNDNPTGQRTVVTIDPARNSGDNGYAFTIAHEGSHVADGGNLVAALPRDLTSALAQGIINGTVPFLGALNANQWGTETRAYQSEAFAAQALLRNQTLSVGGTPSYQIWNPEWAEADRATNRSRGIFRVLTQSRSQGGVYALNPFVGNLGHKLIQ